MATKTKSSTKRKPGIPLNEVPTGMMISLGSIVTDLATSLKGMVTHMLVEMNGVRHYLFQPRGINPENGHPVDNIWVVPERLIGGKLIEEPVLPLNVLNTEVKDTASGFKGKAISLCLHISGCVHVRVQPKGRLLKTGASVDPGDFDIRRLEGKAIKKMTEKQRQKDQEEKPSPASTASFMSAKPKF